MKTFPADVATPASLQHRLPPCNTAWAETSGRLSCILSVTIETVPQTQAKTTLVTFEPMCVTSLHLFLGWKTSSETHTGKSACSTRQSSLGPVCIYLRKGPRKRTGICVVYLKMFVHYSFCLAGYCLNYDHYSETYFY